MFITRRAMTALDELRQLRADANPSVFGMTANTINRRVKAAAQAAGFSGHSGRVGLARRMARAGAPALGDHEAGPVVQQRHGGQVHPRRVGGRRRPVAGVEA